MEHDAQPVEAPAEERTSSALPLYLLLLLAAVTLLVLQWRRPQPPNEFAGRPLPPLEAAGWINAAVPVTNEQLRGKFVLVEFWETSCGFCVREMPEVVKLKDRYRDKGLVVVGLTPEQNEPFQQVSRYVESVAGLDWPIGYGAGFTMELAGVSLFPTYVLYDRAGRAVWGGRYLDDLEAALIKELARG
jgi:thiol-disulfide isomerase/thioredoxin